MKRIIKKKNFFVKLGNVLELLLSLVVIGVVLLGTFDTLRIIWNAYIVDFNNPVEYDQLNNILGQILMLVIGVELVIMLCLHKTGLVLEVLLYAIARKLLLIPKSNSMFDLVLGVVAIGGIFAIKKYLIEDNELFHKEDIDMKEEESFEHII